MSELRKANTDYTYFLTLTVAGWIDIFTLKRYNDVIIESLKFCAANRGLDIFGYVIMPSHVHLVARYEYHPLGCSPLNYRKLVVCGDYAASFQLANPSLFFVLPKLPQACSLW